MFLTVLALSALNEGIERWSGDKYGAMLGSFGALVTLLFGAPKSPLTQPRNAIFGNVVAASTSVLTFYLSGPQFLDVLLPWIAVALAVATAIAVTQRLNILHPPAGAAALIFSTAGPAITDLGWTYLVFPLLCGTVLCLVMAAAFNNCFQSRRFPIYY